MSYYNTSATDVRARKRHLCAWCGVPINTGEIYKNWTSIGEDGPAAVKMHMECKAAENRFAQSSPGEYEYESYSFTRGCICESGDIGHGTYLDCLAVPLPSKASDSRDAKPCLACGRIVEQAREIYVEPFCFACLPPPEPLKLHLPNATDNREPEKIT